ncbi:gliding motility-associated C-terminal domain-containing protein [bacterium SCSIO 12741]|nr:gliding motility-associated C-terminal domain-containing protein [bacterium SCSIO 12741]
MPDTFCLDHTPQNVVFSPALNLQTGTLISGKGVIVTGPNAVYNPFLAGVGNDTVKYTHVDATTGCQNDTSAVFRVDELPMIQILTANLLDYCQGDEDDTLRWGTVMPSQLGAVDFYSYSMVPSYGISNDSIFLPDTLSPGNVSVLYTITDTNGCVADSMVNVVVNAIPQVQLRLNPAKICRNEQPFSFSGTGSPTTGQKSYYLGSGITDSTGSYDPSGVPASYSHDTITYVNISTQGCMGMTTALLILDTVPVVTLNITDTVCDSDPQLVLNYGQPTTNGSWQYSGNSYIPNNTNIFYPIQAPPGKHEVIYSFTDFEGCTASDTDSVDVRPLPIVSMGSVGTICQNDTLNPLNQGTPAGGYYETALGILANDRLNPAQYGVGDNDVWYHFEDSYKCANRDTNVFTILEFKKLRFNNLFSSPICELEGTIDLDHLGDSMGLDPTPSAGGWYSFDGTTPISILDPTDFIGPSDSLPVDTTLYYQFTNVNNCSSIDSQVVTIRPAPQVEIRSADEACKGIEHELEVFGGGNFIWSTGEITKSIRILQDTATGYSVTATDFFGCQDSDSIFVRMSNGIFITAKKDSVTLHKGTEVTRDPLVLYPSDTVAMIGIYETKIEPSHASVFEPQFGIDPRFESEYYYKPDPDFRRIDSVQYKICNITCPNLCDSNYVIFHVFGNPYEFIPGGFSPNGDGVNDTWVVPGIEAFTSSELYIYNRWGDLIYSASPYENEWEGQTNTGLLGGDRVGDGTYYYVLITNGGEPLKGTIEMKSR